MIKVLLTECLTFTLQASYLIWTRNYIAFLGSGRQRPVQHPKFKYDYFHVPFTSLSTTQSEDNVWAFETVILENYKDEV